jgi:hypothetical protein
MPSIKLTLGRLLNAIAALNKVADLIPPGAYFFRVAKLLDAVDAEVVGYNKQRTAIFKRYGIPGKGENGQETLTFIGAAPENVLAGSDALADLLNVETTIPCEPIIWTKLGEEAHKVLTIQNVRDLGPLMVEDEAALVALAAPVTPAAPALALVSEPVKS